MIRITHDIQIDEGEIREEFVRASGPGGQNVNRVATAVQLRFHVANSPSLPDDVRERLVKLAGRRVTDEGVLVIDARRYRTQKRNREDALAKLARIVREALVRPKRRRATRRTPASIEKRLDEKKRRGQIKKDRRRIDD